MLKTNVEALENASALVSKLNVHTYNYLTDKYPNMNLQEGVRYGFLAQEMKQVLPQFVKTTQQPLNEPEDAEGNRQEVKYLEFDAVNYVELIPILTKAIQEQQVKIEELAPQNVAQLQAELEAVKAKNVQLEDKMEAILNRLNAFDGDLQKCCFSSGQSMNVGSSDNQQSAIDNPVLEQNIPNPFRENTTIKYYLPSDSRTATITITDLNGVQQKQFDLQGKGFGQVLISGGSFAAGTYVYTLTVNGNQVDSKRMMLL